MISRKPGLSGPWQSYADEWARAARTEVDYVKRAIADSAYRHAQARADREKARR